MARILYLEGAGGISGDMTVAALLDLGASREKLDAAIGSLNLSGFEYIVRRGKSYGIAGVDFDVTLNSVGEHNPGHEHGHEHMHEHGHEHMHEHGHEHMHEHGHEHGHEHVHRGLSEVCAVIDGGNMSERARGLARSAFQIVAEAEAEAHGCSVEEVHFHEVGAVDSIVDIVSASVCYDDLCLDGCAVTGLSEGSGYVRCAHGDLPVPVPAVLNIAASHSIALRRTDVCGEMVTPTGIALAAAFRTSSVLPAEYFVEKVGIGLGKRDFGRANMLRAMILKVPDSECGADSDGVWLMEANIDDCTGEELGYAMEKLFDAGARDVHFIPCQMKKNRPGFLVRAVAGFEDLGAVEHAFFKYTSTIGIRRQFMRRTCLARSVKSVNTQFGDVLVKTSSGCGVVRVSPEYESVRAAAEASGRSLRDVYSAAAAASGGKNA